MSNFTPDYRDADFQTMVDRLRTLLSKTESFKDYDFEGANITILMELVAYVGDLNTFFTNKLAQNIHSETANVYEVVHSLVGQQGHNASGYVGAELTFTVRIYKQSADEIPVVYFDANDTLFLPQWFRIDTGLTTDSGESIFYTLTEDVYYPVTTADLALGYAEFNITVRQGEAQQQAIEYTGEDIVSNQIVLPFRNWDMSNYPYDESPPSIFVTVGTDDTGWVRINDFYDDISGLLEEDNAYMLLYDKYQRSVLAFSNTRNIPELTDPIKVYLLETLGLDGMITKDIFSVELDTDTGRIVQLNGTTPFESPILGDTENFVTRVPDSGATEVIPASAYTIRNEDASYGASNPQTIDELKEAGKAAASSQQRNVTKSDYIGNLERRGDVTVANAWGEQEEHPDTLILENYNKAYISMIPVVLDTALETYIYMRTEDNIDPEFNHGLEIGLDFPTQWNEAWVENDIKPYLEPRKMLGIYEIIDQTTLPELVYFRFDFGLKVRRTYNWTKVRDTVLNKLIYYFQNSNREFGEIIDFREVYNYILDVNNVSATDDFDLVRGIQSLVIRDVLTYRDPLLLESEITPEACEDMGAATAYGVGTTSIVVDSLVGSPTGWFYDIPTTTATGIGSGCTLDIEISPGPFVNTVVVNNPGYEYEVGDTFTVDATDFGATSGQFTFTVVSVSTELICSLNTDIDEMYIYPDNIYNYFPHWVDINMNPKSDVDAVYNQLQPIQLGYKQFPQLASDLCVFAKEG